LKCCYQHILDVRTSAHLPARQDREVSVCVLMVS
jgi:hypothetical protein